MVEERGARPLLCQVASLRLRGGGAVRLRCGRAARVFPAPRLVFEGARRLHSLKTNRPTTSRRAARNRPNKPPETAPEKDDVPYIIEANPRASRTVPFVAKAVGHPIAKYASLLMSGKTLAELGFTEEPKPEHVSVKEVVLPFNKFPGADTLLVGLGLGLVGVKLGFWIGVAPGCVGMAPVSLGWRRLG